MPAHRLSQIRTSLRTAILANAGFTTAVHRFEPGPEYKDAAEVIWFRNASADSMPAAPGSIFDDVALEVVIKTRASGQGDTAAGTAEDRALALLEIIEDTITDDPTLTNLVLDTNLTRYESQTDVASGDRICTVVAVVEFQLQVNH